MTKINCYCKECRAWREAEVIDIYPKYMVLRLSCGHRLIAHLHFESARVLVESGFGGAEIWPTKRSSR